MTREAPVECPVCAAALRVSSPETEDSFAEWEYECGAILQRNEKGNIMAYSNCPEAMTEALDLLNASPA